MCFEVIKRDSLNSSHPISNQAETPTQIQEMFDDVSYKKVVNAVGSGRWAFKGNRRPVTSADYVVAPTLLPPALLLVLFAVHFSDILHVL